jgi:hypothetical protein
MLDLKDLNRLNYLKFMAFPDVQYSTSIYITLEELEVQLKHQSPRDQWSDLMEIARLLRELSIVTGGSTVTFMLRQRVDSKMTIEQVIESLECLLESLKPKEPLSLIKTDCKYFCLDRLTNNQCPKCAVAPSTPCQDCIDYQSF